MNPSSPKSRRRRTPSLAPELLEGRELMTGGVGSTFAIIPATITTAHGHATVSFNLDPKLFTDPGNKPWILGIDVAPNTNSSVVPTITSVVAPNGKSLPVAHATFDPSVTKTATTSASKVSSAALVTVPGLPAPSTAAGTAKNGQPVKAKAVSDTYKVTVSGLDKNVGGVLLGFYMPGDANGAGIVNQADLNAIAYGMNTNSSDTTGKYSFDADANRNGKIDQTDLAIAKKDLGVGTTVSPVISANLDSSNVVDPKNRVTNNGSVHITGAATPNSTLTYSLPNGYSVATTADATGNYSVTLNLLPGANTFSVTATDAFNQKITGSISPITYTPLS
jgi:Bacterial Ig domain/Dockerin type I domain